VKTHQDIGESGERTPSAKSLMTDIELSIPIDFTAIQIRRANASITEETAQILAAELHDIIKSVRELCRAQPNSNAEYEEISLVDALRRTALKISLDDGGAAAEESVWAVKRLMDLGGDQLYLRYLRLSYRVYGADWAAEFERDTGSCTPSTTSAPPEEPTAKHERIVSLDDVEETETSLWVLEQLNRIQELVVEHGADDEMLEAVEYLIEDNDRWINPKTAMLLGSQGTGKA
jgi:hypothetical protein